MDKDLPNSVIANLLSPEKRLAPPLLLVQTGLDSHVDMVSADLNIANGGEPSTGIRGRNVMDLFSLNGRTVVITGRLSHPSVQLATSGREVMKHNHKLTLVSTSVKEPLEASD